MYLSNESVLIILLVGLAAGWLASHIVRGTAFGLVGDMVIGVIGAFVGHWLICLLYTSPSPRDLSTSRMPSSA